MIQLTLPWPPSVNHYWFQKGNRRFIGAKGKKFREDVQGILDNHRLDETRHIIFNVDRLKVSINVFQPDRRKRDLDNLFKATLDALQHAGMYEDDSQIDDLRIVRLDVDKENPRLEVSIWTL